MEGPFGAGRQLGGGEEGGLRRGVEVEGADDGGEGDVRTSDDGVDGLGPDEVFGPQRLPSKDTSSTTIEARFGEPSPTNVLLRTIVPRGLTSCIASSRPAGTPEHSTTTSQSRRGITSVTDVA